MTYKDRFGSTKIRDTRSDHLEISWDYEDDVSKLSQRKAVVLFTPNIEDKKEHYHIELNHQQAEILRDWLDQFLDEVGYGK